MDRAHGFAGAMVELWRTRRTGFLRVSAQQVRTSISFLEGVPVWATGGGRGETLGRLCVGLGLIDEAQYERAILKLVELDDRGANARLGDVMIDLGFLDGPQLQRALRTQVREKIVACFQWSEPELQIDADSGEIRRGNLAPWPVPALLAEGIVRHYDDARCDRILEPQLRQRVRAFDSASTIATLLNLPPALLESFQEEQRLEEVCKKGMLYKQLSSAMLLLGFFDVVGSDDIFDQLRLPATMDLSFGETSEDLIPDEAQDVDLMTTLETEHQRIQSSTPEIYFGIRPNASPKEVNTAFELRVRPFVQAAMTGTNSKEQARLTEIYNAVAALRDSLLERKRPKGAGRPSPSSELSAEAAFLRGKQSLERGDRKMAAEMFARAIEKSPDTREYRMFRAYTDLLSATADWDRDKAFAETRKLAKETLEQDTKNGRAHLILGRLFRLEDKEERARQEFEAAVEASNDKEAELELRVLQRRMAKKAAEKEKRGLFFWKKP